MDDTMDIQEQMAVTAQALVETAQEALGEGFEAMVMIFPTEEAAKAIVDTGELSSCAVCSSAQEEHTHAMISVLFQAEETETEGQRIWTPGGLH